MNFWDFVWLLIWSFFFVMYLMVLFQIIGDLFRDPRSADSPRRSGSSG